MPNPLQKMLIAFKNTCSKCPPLKRFIKKVKYGLIRLGCALRGGQIGSAPVILGYHAVGCGDNNISISAKRFREQIEWLVHEKFHVMTLKEMWALQEQGVPLDPKTVVLTFDDGYECFLKNAAPILSEFGLDATAFIITHYVGKTNEYDDDVAEVEKLDMMTWEQVRELDRLGWDIQSHTHQHYPMTGLEPNLLQKELERSKEILEAQLAKPVDFFCYPYGAFDRDAMAAVERAGYKAAVTCIPGSVKTDAQNRYCLSRAQVDSLMSLKDFKVIFHSAYREMMDHFTQEDRAQSLLSSAPADKADTLEKMGATV